MDEESTKVVQINRAKELRSLTSVMISRQKFLAKMGQTFAGARDVFTVLGYTKLLTYEHYYARYLRDNIASRIVNAPPAATWSNPPVLIPRKKNKTEGEKFLKSWEELQEKHSIFYNLDRADKLSGIGRYAVLFIGLRGGAPLDNSVRATKLTPDDLLYLSPYSEDLAVIDKIEDKPTNPRFGKPSLYSITTGKDIAGVKSFTLKVHHSRVLHLAEGLLQDDIFGKPRLESVYNLFDDLAKVVGGSAEFFWRIADRGIHADIDPELELQDGDEEAFSDSVEDYYNNLTRYIKTRGVTIKSLGSETADPRGPFQGIISLISGTTKIPQRILLGSERGQLASSQDRASWNELINERNVTYVGPKLIRPLIDRFQQWGILPKIEYDVEWPILQPLTEEERSVVSARTASAALNIAKARNLGGLALSEEEWREKFLGLKGTAKNPKEIALATPPVVEKEEEEEEEGKEKKEGEENNNASSDS